MPAPWSSTMTPRPGKSGFNGRLHAFARYWRLPARPALPIGRAPRARMSAASAMLKRDAIAGRRFPSWSAFVAHLEAMEPGDCRPARASARRAKPADRAVCRGGWHASSSRAAARRSGSSAICVRKVRPDCAIDLDTDSYSVPWRLVGETSRSVLVVAGRVIVRHAGEVVADRPLCAGADDGSPIGPILPVWSGAGPTQEASGVDTVPALLRRSPDTRPSPEGVGDDRDRPRSPGSHAGPAQSSPRSGTSSMPCWMRRPARR